MENGGGHFSPKRFPKVGTRSAQGSAQGLHKVVVVRATNSPFWSRAAFFVGNIFKIFHARIDTDMVC
jgi:hypothetical protein